MLRDISAWIPLLQVVFGTIVVMIGWLAVHALNATRDRRNKERELRISYLIDAYRRLERSALAREPESKRDDIEIAIADMQLFGTVKQVRLAQKFANDIATTETAGMDHLLEELRLDLRRELNLEDAGRTFHIFRLTKIHKSPIFAHSPEKTKQKK